MVEPHWRPARAAAATMHRLWVLLLTLLAAARATLVSIWSAGRSAPPTALLTARAGGRSGKGRGSRSSSVDRSTDSVESHLRARLPRQPLQRPQPRKTLVLDLDETLIHSVAQGVPATYDARIDVVIDGAPCTFYVSRRPYADYFLQQVRAGGRARRAAVRASVAAR